MTDNFYFFEINRLFFIRGFLLLKKKEVEKKKTRKNSGFS